MLKDELLSDMQNLSKEVKLQYTPKDTLIEWLNEAQEYTKLLFSSVERGSIKNAILEYVTVIEYLDHVATFLPLLRYKVLKSQAIDLKVRAKWDLAEYIAKGAIKQ